MIEQKSRTPAAKNGKSDKGTQDFLKRQKNAQKRLRDLYRIEHYRRYPNIPEYGKVYPSAWKPSTANGLTRMIIEWLRLNGHAAERVNVTGIPVDRRRIVTDCIGKKRIIGSVTWRKSHNTLIIQDHEYGSKHTGRKFENVIQ